MAVVANPRWVALLIAAFLVYFATSAALFATPIGKQALVDQWERTVLAFGREVDDARYAELQALSERWVAYAALSSLARGPLASFGLAGLLYLGLRATRRPARNAATFGQVLAVVAHAAVIPLVRQLISAPVSYARESIASPTTVVRVFPMLDEGSAVARFLGLIDVVLLWWVVVLAIGVSVLSGSRTRTVAALFLGVYIAAAAVLAGVMAALGATS